MNLRLGRLGFLLLFFTGFFSLAVVADEVDEGLEIVKDPVVLSAAEVKEVTKDIPEKYRAGEVIEFVAHHKGEVGTEASFEIFVNGESRRIVGLKTEPTHYFVMVASAAKIQFVHRTGAPIAIQNLWIGGWLSPRMVRLEEEVKGESHILLPDRQVALYLGSLARRVLQYLGNSRSIQRAVVIPVLAHIDKAFQTPVIAAKKYGDFSQKTVASYRSALLAMDEKDPAETLRALLDTPATSRLARLLLAVRYELQERTSVE